MDRVRSRRGRKASSGLFSWWIVAHVARGCRRVELRGALKLESVAKSRVSEAVSVLVHVCRDGDVNGLLFVISES